MRKLFISLAVFALVASMALAVTQVGTMIVTIKSKQGQLLPGATVMIKSVAMIGTRTQLTGANGKTTFRNLPPGDYSVTVNMDKFQPLERKGVQVIIQKTSRIDIELELGQADEVVTVVGSAPIVDTSSSGLQQDFDFDQNINHVPSFRHYNDLLGATGGAEDANNPSVYGAGSYGNQYLVDGINTTDVRSQTWGEQFNIDIIQDVAVFTSGVSAEYGQFQGAVMNIVTKSGANYFNGMVRLELQRRGWNDFSDKTNRQAGADATQWNYSGGGPIWPDLAWWYVGYNDFASLAEGVRYTNPQDLDETIPYLRPYVGHQLVLKGTLQPTEDLRLLFTYMESPVVIENVSVHYINPRTQESAEWEQTQGSDGTLIGSGSFIVNEETFVEARYTRTRGLLDIVPQPAVGGYDIPIVAAQTTGPTYWSDDGWYWGAPYIELYTSKRNVDIYGAAFNWLLDTESMGNHDIKLGFDYQDLWSTVGWKPMAGDEFIAVTAQTGNAFANWQMSDPYLRIVYENKLDPAEDHEYIYSGYIQDSIEVSDNMTLNIGVRVDPMSMQNNQEQEVYSVGVFDEIQPRVGLVYDFGDGLSARASFGRYYSMMTLYMLGDFDVFPTPESDIYYYWGGADWVYDFTAYFGQAVSPHSLASDLGNQYVDDISVGFDYQFSPDLAVGITGIWRTFRDLVVAGDMDEDGNNLWENVYTDAYGSKYRDYKAAILKLIKRPTHDNIYMQGTLTIQSLEGLGAVATGNDASPRGLYFQNKSQTPELIENWYGDMGSPSMIGRLQTTYFFTDYYYAGIDVLWNNGIKPSSLGQTTIAGKPYAWYPNGRGDMDRLEDVWFISLQVGTEIKVEFPFDVPLTDNNILLGIYLDIQDLTDFTGTIGVVQSVSSPNYGNPTTYSNARTYKLGFRVEL
jgi:hypothetical protein